MAAAIAATVLALLAGCDADESGETSATAATSTSVADMESSAPSSATPTTDVPVTPAPVAAAPVPTSVPSTPAPQAAVPTAGAQKTQPLGPVPPPPYRVTTPPPAPLSRWVTLSDKQCWGGDGLWNMEYTINWEDGRSEHYGPVYHVRERFVLDLYSGGELWHVSNGDFNCP